MKSDNRLVNMAIEVCADDVTLLRKCDVERAMETAFRNGSYFDLVIFLLRHRTDLYDEINRVEIDRRFDRLARIQL